MKKLTSLISLAACLATVSAFGYGSTGFTGQPSPTPLVVTLTAGTPTCVLSNNVTIQSVSLTTTAASALVNFYDCNNTNAPYYGTNYVNSSTYVTSAGIATNYVSFSYQTNYSVAGTLLLYTNYYTNTGWWTYSVTNTPSTNALPVQASLFAINGQIASYPSPISFQQGITLLSASNVTAILYYTPNK